MLIIFLNFDKISKFEASVSFMINRPLKGIFILKMFLKKIELILHKIKLHKKINQIIFETLFAFYESGHFIKTQDSFIFSITLPDDKSIYLMVANFPREDGFTQTQIIDDRLPVSADLKIILNFEQLIFKIKSFLKTKLHFIL